MGLHRATRHLELAGNLRVVTPLQEEFDNLLFPRTQPNGLLLHQTSPLFWHRLSRQPGARLGICKTRCIQNATLRKNLQ